MRPSVVINLGIGVVVALTAMFAGALAGALFFFLGPVARG